MQQRDTYTPVWLWFMIIPMSISANLLAIQMFPTLDLFDRVILFECSTFQFSLQTSILLWN